MCLNILNPILNLFAILHIFSRCGSPPYIFDKNYIRLKSTFFCKVYIQSDHFLLQILFEIYNPKHSIVLIPFSYQIILYLVLFSQICRAKSIPYFPKNV